MTTDAQNPANALLAFAPALPNGVEFRDARSRAIWAWLSAFQKATKAQRVYAENNAMLHRFVDACVQQTNAVLTLEPELTLTVREDRLLFNKDPVLIDTDREQGIPFVFYRNAFRRLTFVAGFDREELLALMGAITNDYASLDLAQEDLTTALWRLHLPHLRYVTIDAMSVRAKTAEDETERQDIERVQGEIESIIAAVYDSRTPVEDAVSVSITARDLEVLEDVRNESTDDLDALDFVTSRAIAETSKEELEAVRVAIAQDGLDILTYRLSFVFANLLTLGVAPAAEPGFVHLARQIVDAMLGARHYDRVTQFVASVGAALPNQPELANKIRAALTEDGRVIPILDGFNGKNDATVKAGLAFLRSLGAGVGPALVRNLDTLDAPAHRKAVVALVAELGVVDVATLTDALESAKWFVAKDLLAIAAALPSKSRAAVVLPALSHAHPKVRADAVLLLRDFAAGTADRLLARRIVDDDSEVRRTAAMVAADRQSAEAVPELATLLAADDLKDKPPEEIAVVMSTYVALVGDRSLQTLTGLLNPGLLDSLGSTEVRVAAARALGALDTEAARAALRNGTRTLNARVRQACQQALAGRGAS